MKPFSLVVLAGMACIAQSPLFAQNPDSEYQQAADAKIVNLDKSQIPTGVLYDRVYPLANLNNFNQGQNDTSNYEHFYQAYYELYQSSYNRIGKPNPDEFDNTIRLSNVRGTIPIGFLHYNFNSIDLQALEKNQFSIQNDLVYDVSGRSSSPYLPRQALVLAVLSTEKLEPGIYTFKWASEFIQGNTNVQITNLQADFGYGLSSISLNVPVSFYLGGYGLKVVRFVAQLSDGRQLTTYGGYAMEDAQSSILSRGTAVTAENPMPCYGPYEITSDLTFKGYEESVASVGKGQVSIYYRTTESCGTGKKNLNKPLVILDGFDPGDTRKAPKLYGEYLTYNNGTANFANEMRSRGYDIVILNFHKYGINNAERDGGSDYIERNAYVLIKLIQEINAELQASGSTNQLTIIGPSMGGLISRYALTYLEKQCLNHNTKLWISFDAPHQGATIPIGDQWILNYLGQKLGGGARKSRDAKLNNPAAKQMLIHHYTADSNLPKGAAGFRDNFQTTLNNMGFPRRLKRIAIINGSINGTPSSLAVCQPSNHLRIRLSNFANPVGWLVRVLLGSSAPSLFDFFVAPAPSFGNTCQVFEGRMSAGFIQQRNATAYPNSSSIDLAPGGTYAVDEEVRDGVASAVSGTQLSLVVENVIGPNVYCFIPSFSALALNPSNRNFSENLSTRNLVSTQETPFEDYYPKTPSEGPTNDDHVSLTSGGVAWIVDKILNTPNSTPFSALSISASSNSPQPCGGTLQLTATCTNCVGSIGYSWSGPNGFSSIQQNPSISNLSAANAGTYVLTVSNEESCSVTASIEIAACSGNPNPVIPAGCYTLKAKHSNKFIQPENNNGGARLRQQDANGQTNQIFNFEVVDGTAYRINSQSASKVVEAANAGSGNATPVVLGDWSGGNHQKWNLEAWGDGTFKLSPKNAPGQLFDVEGTSVDNGAGIHLWGQHSGNNQRFFVQASGCTGGPVDPPGSCSLTSIRIYPRKNCCPGRTLGGQIQYSTVGQNGPWTTAYTISAEAANTYTDYPFTAVSLVKALRYRSPDGGYGNVAEIEFYNGATKLDGGFFHDGGGPWNGQADRTADKAVDGNPDTFYDSANDNGGFVGFVLSGCGGGCSAPVPGIAGGGNVCNGGTVTLTASGCSGIYHWSNGTNGVSQITVGTAGPYSVTCEQGGCTSGSSAQITVTANCGGGGCVVNRVRYQFRNAGDCCMDRLVGGKIQGSNDQSNWSDLYTFSENGNGTWQEKTFANSTAYGYVRFVAGPSGYGEFHELEFYNGSTKLNGTPFGSGQGSSSYEAAFDGNLTTQWHGSAPGNQNVAGLQLTGCGGGGRQAAGDAFGEEPTEPKGLVLVPNPASDFVEVRLPAGERLRRVQGYDVLGRVVCESEQSRLFVGRLPGGTYLIRVETGAGRVYSKVLLKP